MKPRIEEMIPLEGRPCLCRQGIVLETCSKPLLEQGLYFSLDSAELADPVMVAEYPTNAGGNKVYYVTDLLRDLTLES